MRVAAVLLWCTAVNGLRPSSRRLFVVGAAVAVPAAVAARDLQFQDLDARHKCFHFIVTTALASKLGTVLVVSGGLHVTYMYVFILDLIKIIYI